MRTAEDIYTVGRNGDIIAFLLPRGYEYDAGFLTEQARGLLATIALSVITIGVILYMRK